MTCFGDVQVGEQFCGDWFWQVSLFWHFGGQEPLPVGLGCSDRCCFVQVDVKSAQEFDVVVLVIGIFVAAAQG